MAAGCGSIDARDFVVDHVAPGFPDDWEALAAASGIRQDDPLWPMLSGIADYAATLDARAARDEQMRAALRADIRAATEAVRENNRRSLLTDVQVREYVIPGILAGWVVSGVVLAGALMAGAGIGGYAYGRWSVIVPPSQIVAGVDGGTPRCDAPGDDGAELCWIPVYRRPPPVPAAPATPTPAPHVTKQSSFR